MPSTCGCAVSIEQFAVLALLKHASRVALGTPLVQLPAFDHRPVAAPLVQVVVFDRSTMTLMPVAWYCSVIDELAGWFCSAVAAKVPVGVALVVTTPTAVPAWVTPLRSTSSFEEPPRVMLAGAEARLSRS